MYELHAHLGGSVPAPVLWETLQDAGLQTPFATFDDLQRHLTPNPDEITCLDDFLGRFFDTTEFIQSSPMAMEASCFHVVAKAYRRNWTPRRRLEGIEVRFNPAKRLRDGQYEMRPIMEAALRGFQRASSYYRVRTGVILSMGRDMTFDQNERIVEAAIRWYGVGTHKRGGFYGVVGIDMAGPESKALEFNSDWLNQVAVWYEEARRVGLGTTYHIGETRHTGHTGVANVIEKIKLDRIGHGIRVVDCAETIKLLSSSNIGLEICPSANLLTKVISRKQLAEALYHLLDERIPFTICTDNPYLVQTNLGAELQLVDELTGRSISQWSEEHGENLTFLK